MKKPMITIHNVETGEITEREMNDVEFSQYETDQLIEEQRKIQAQAQANIRQAILDRLGLTEEEARLLLG